jgi:ParB-like chromosome segregation protein Spo0J
MHKIDMVKFEDLQIAPFKATHILRPDLLTLSASLRDLGFIIPIVIQKSTNIIIDGNERVLIVKSQKRITDIVGDECPVVTVDCDNMEAQMLHLRLNRSRGNLLAKPMSRIIRNIVQSKRYNKSDLGSLLQMKHDEMQLLLDGSLLKHKKIAEHSYSRAWVPIEADPKITEVSLSIEKPPNADR